ncbi:LETM1 domain-containing protein 1 isoform X2 [Cuculus canorus]|uniref:LETM1 domain-containing protein 1 isoform X2 n=1 Tax=Cuculus canorus TaxID=55661 RepID=UPI0023AAD44A|nr:LETM1 domain-containing protein 1 isoform X2 [Cuculus canorus]
MALCRARACAPFWRLGPGPGPAGLRCFRRPLRPPGCCLSAKASSRSILAALISGAKRINGKYERFLERTFPRFYVLYSTFTRGMGETFLLFQEEQRQLEMFPVSFLGREGYSRFSDENRGIQALFVEVKEIQKIRSQMSRQRLSTHQLPYREMERLRQFRRDVIKAIPIGIIAIPPFANFLVIVLMYFFPRQLLIRYFWTPSQQVEFLETYDTIRRGSYLYVVESLAVAARSLPEPQLRSRLQDLCAEVQRGSQPRAAELYAVRSLFSGSPLALNKLHVAHVKALSQVLFLTTHLPVFFLRHRLRSHVLEIRHLDRALLRLGLGQLSEEELRAACYLRGLNSTKLEMSECRAWLEQWLGLSCKLQASDASLLANSMVLLSLNYARAKA